MDITELVSAVFTKSPQPKKSCNLELNECDNEYIFQLLLNILMEGICVLNDENMEFDNMTDKHKFKLNEYMESLGYTVYLITELKDENEHKLLFTDLSNETHYCHLKLNNHPSYFLEFAQNYSGHELYNKKYKFVLNTKSHDRNKLSDYYCIYVSNTKKVTVKFEQL